MQSEYDETWPPPYEEEPSEESDQEEVDDTSRRDPLSSQEPSSSRRSPILPGVLGVLLIIMLGVAVWWAVRTILLPSASDPMATPVWTPAAQPSTSVAPTAVPRGTGVTPTPVPAGPTAPVAIGVGQTVRVFGTDGEGISLRSAPGADQDRLDIIAEGATLQVLEGPEAADDYTWWKLESEDGVVGWAAADWLEAVEPSP